MATPLTASQMLAALRSEGLKPREYKSWKTHGRDTATGKPFGPVHGIVIHHTAGRDSLSLVYNGRSDLPGPLAHAHLSKTGTLTLTGNGRVNHAGSFPHSVRDRLIAEAKPLARPVGAEDTDANDYTYGIEIENLGNGKDPYPDVQYKAAVKWAAAICRAHGWSSNSVIGHKEGTTRKVDPSFDMNKFRSDVAAQLNGHTTTPTPDTKTEASTMATPGGPYLLSLAMTTDLDLATGSWYYVPFDTEYVDEAGIHAAGSTDFGAKGYYVITAAVRFSNLTNGLEAQARLVEFSGTTAVKYHPIVEGIGSNGSTFFQLAQTEKLAAGNTLRLQVAHFDTDTAHLDRVDLKAQWWVTA